MGRPRKNKKEEKVKRPRGRQRVCFSFEEAKILIAEENLNSISEYTKWHALNKPCRMPKRPDRAYKKQWKGWSDFLGTNNPYPFIRKNFRSYNEAKLYVHKLNIKNIQEWRELCKAKKIPEDIPARPDLYYRKTNEWYTWKDFLGYSITEKLKAQTLTSKILVIYQDETNMYSMTIIVGGKSNAIDFARANNLRILECFIYDRESNLSDVINRTGNQLTHVSSGVYYFNGGFISNLIFELNSIFEKCS